MIQLYHTILYQPLFNLLVYFYNIVPGHDIGLAILLLTILIKLILYPLSVSSIKQQKVLRDLQPKMEEIKAKYSNNKAELGKATMELYKQEKVSPFSSCLPILIQFPFLIAVYQVFRSGLTQPQSLELLYSFVKNPGMLNSVSMGFLDLAKPNLVLAALAAISQYLSGKMLISKKQPPIDTKKTIPGSQDENMMSMVNKNMTLMMPIFTFFIGISLPGGLTFYWFITTMLMVLQQWYMFRKHDSDQSESKIRVIKTEQPNKDETNK